LGLTKIKSSVQNFFSGVFREMHKAICVFNSGSVRGVVRFSQLQGSKITKVEGEIRGLTDGLHGLHIHEWGDLSSGCESAGAHFNPFDSEHGGLHSTVRHVGDLGNITSIGGTSRFEIFPVNLDLYGPYSIVGRSLIVHADPDDLGQGGSPLSKTTGNSGARVACGVIGLAK
jgi:Cu-Zn family superoxide dismutase